MCRSLTAAPGQLYITIRSTDTTVQLGQQPKVIAQVSVEQSALSWITLCVYGTTSLSTFEVETALKLSLKLHVLDNDIFYQVLRVFAPHCMQNHSHLFSANGLHHRPDVLVHRDWRVFDKCMLSFSPVCSLAMLEAQRWLTLTSNATLLMAIQVRHRTYVVKPKNNSKKGQWPWACNNPCKQVTFEQTQIYTSLQGNDRRDAVIT